MGSFLPQQNTTNEKKQKIVLKNNGRSVLPSTPLSIELLKCPKLVPYDPVWCTTPYEITFNVNQGLH